MLPFLVAVLFAAVFARFFRWLLAKLMKRPPGLILPHACSFVGVLILLPLGEAEGPFAHGMADVVNAAMIYFPAQLICLLYDLMRARKAAPRPAE